jgi:hypothetical protein
VEVVAVGERTDVQSEEFVGPVTSFISSFDEQRRVETRRYARNMRSLEVPHVVIALERPLVHDLG